ncbi:hypothetical protein QUC32_00005 [Novosphingobium resinovorum]|uniref:hypothetical protein n=1 Tax=Novosphingobium resinovorum TaxID=158500 RepID=UPI0025A06C91|nr:hypothetical protein [Novosphingobium resinovorum]WJM25380.1 hypothetical protein QUC32_00005 [Novosphingobium resinovorum]
MTPRAAIQQIARMVRDDIRSGALSPGAHSIADMLAEQPEALLLIVDLAGAEGRKKRPDAMMHHAYSFMLGNTLEQLRQRSEAGSGHASMAIENVRTAIAQQIRTGKLAATAALALVSAFSRAGVEVGDDIRSAMDHTMIQTGASQLNLPPPDVDEMLKDLVKACEGDPFLIHTQFAELTAAMPAGLQLSLLEGLVLADESSLREAAIGWLLAEPAIAAPLASMIEETASRGLVSAASVTNLMLIRNWVAEDRRRAIDAIIKAARFVGSVSEKRPAIQVRELLISERDGAGAQSIFASIKQGRKNALVSILVKQGHGVRDAWVAGSLSRPEIEDMLGHIASEMSIHEATAEDAALLLSSALADGLASSPPPFGLVQAITLIGLSDVAPRSLSVHDLVASMLEGVDEAASNSRAVERAVRASGRWLAINPQLESWFENGDDVTLAIKGKRKIEDRIAAIIEMVLEPKRGFWASVAAWSAFAQRGEGDDPQWIEMALVAREMATQRPLAEVPLARFIAVQTVEAART